jgi:DNA-binding NarL/FixJ family response regulator
LNSSPHEATDRSEPAAKIRLALVEDDRRLRETLSHIFCGDPAFDLAGAWPDAEATLEAVGTTRPDVVLMDIQLPGMTGIECLRRIKSQHPGTRVVMLTVFDDSDTLFQSLVAGADGYLVKGSPVDSLLEAVRDIASGGAPMSPQIARRMVEYFHRFMPGDIRQESTDASLLSHQEQQVLSLMAEGKHSKEVAQALGISWETVRKHLVNIYRKLHVHSQAEALAKFRQLIRPPPKPA